MFFDITHKEKNTRARAGIIHTDHGDIKTPVFMPVGTQATVKSLDPRDIAEVGSQIILSNTYHLHLRPGEDLIASFGGLHKFMKWDRPILTDSGGFQVFSLKHKNIKTLKQNNAFRQDQGSLVKIDENGVDFQSYIDGSTHRFTPEIAIDIQHKLGADIIMAFDECTPDDADMQYTKEAMARTHAWANRSLIAHQKNTSYHGYKQFLFGILQGANHKDLREESAQAISALDFDGIAIGGESIGYNMTATKNILEWIYPHIPEDKPHYAMGLGFTPLDLFDVVERGVDMFDCVAPTRMARNGTVYVKNNIPPPGRGRLGGGLPLPKQEESPAFRRTKYTINITNARFRDDQSPIDPRCACSTCTTFSRAYLHHLFAAEELLAYRLATIHNLTFFLTLMKDMRQAIQEDRFLELKKEWQYQ